jgi:hypothetical protein
VQETGVEVRKGRLEMKNCPLGYYTTTTYLYTSTARPPKNRLVGHLSDRPLHKLLLQAPNLLLELFDLFPAVQRSSVVLPQARDNSLLRPRDVLIGLLQLLPLFQLRLQLLDLLGDASPAHVLLSLLLRECGAAGSGILDLLDEGRSVVWRWLVGQVFAELGEVLGFLVAQFLELGS